MAVHVHLHSADDESFEKLEHSLAHRSDVTNPRALAAYIGRRDLGKKEFQRRAAAGRDVGSESFNRNGRVGYTINTANDRRDARDALRYGQRVPREVLERLARQGEIELEGDLPTRSGATVQVRQGSRRFMVVVENNTSNDRRGTHDMFGKR